MNMAKNESNNYGDFYAQKHEVMLGDSYGRR